ncbi:MAG: biotin/lipoyl-binding protein [Christensenellaceae bacterium]|nr:biotin/lipoyl-binding protein [Christensenellaceae bacterium]
MRKFIVNVNGTSYEVEVEELSGQEAEKASKPAAAAKPASAAPSLSGSEKTINAPMPGNILSVNVKPGDSFRSGQVLLVLEAMKMENEIMAPHDGKVVAVNVQKGASVNTGDMLIAYN